MPNLKCKMCGAELDISLFDKDTLLATCEYCGAKQTIPSVDSEKKLALFNRAIRLLHNCEFDKASGVYESIVADFPEEAEAYWGLVLCRYGIEYVDDPATGRKIPTCHRSSFESVLEDRDFEQACEYADYPRRAQYREEAKQIEELRRRIIEVSNKEEPYDIFICYKETDEKKNRTVDSLIAEDIYNALTEKGYRVFFSRITLEDKLGVEYEPYIFAALHSAKIMLAVGTDYEYYNAVWVKNEWSRFLQLIAGGEKKTLIPCYKDLDAYDMPKEFARLQAQDMGKVGAMQDLLRGVGKILPKQSAQTAARVGPSGSTGNLTARGYIFLEDGLFEKADEYFEKALDENATDCKAYIGKFLCALKAPSLEKAQNLQIDTDAAEYKDFLRAERYANEEELAQLKAFRSAVEAANRARKEQNDKQYHEAQKLFDEGRFEEAIAAFKALNGYKDSADRIAAAANALIEFAAVGSTVCFGAYKQDGDPNSAPKPIEWIVLENSRYSKLLISKYALDRLPFHNVSGVRSITWESCSLRKWLNADFYNTAFNDSEKSMISPTKVKYRNDGIHTIDNVFLLDIAEAKKYFSTNTSRMCDVTDYAKKQGAAAGRSQKVSGKDAGWWLSTHSDMFGSVSIVNCDGTVGDCSFGAVADTAGAVRPAIRIRRDKDTLYKEALKLFESGKYTEAIADFKELGDYKDSVQQISNCKNAQDLQLFENEKQALINADVGSSVYLGSWPTAEGRRLRWRVLLCKEDKLLLHCCEVIDCLPYDSSEKPVTWETCSLRKWLNETFIHAFTANEASLIKNSVVGAARDSKTGMASGNHTIDQVFILSEEEDIKYNDRSCDTTYYAQQKGVYYSRQNAMQISSSQRWLRSPGPKLYAKYTTNGCIIAETATGKSSGIRPAIWVDCGKERSYSKALNLFNNKQYSEALTAFRKLKGYKDSDDYSAKCETIPNEQYNKALELQNSGEYEKALEMLKALNGYKDSASKIKDLKRTMSEKSQSSLSKPTVGSTVFFGTWGPKDNEEEKEPIAWIVLDVTPESALLISKYVLDKQYYSAAEDNCSWLFSHLCSWLNDTMYKNAFNDEEKKRIRPTASSPGSGSKDKLFLLSADEVEKYFPSKKQRPCYATDYALKMGVTPIAGTASWWLKSSSGPRSNKIEYIGSIGEIWKIPASEKLGVRPALWYDYLTEEEKKKRAAEEKQLVMALRRERGVCPYCGGVFKKNLFGTKCMNCGRKKDY